MWNRLCLGYEDTNDHDELRRDPLLATVCGKLDPTDSKRKHSRDRGNALAGKSTLNRLETYGVGTPENQKYKKIYYSEEAIDQFFVDTFIKTTRKGPEEIIIDLDATDDPLHGHQEERFFHGYYDCYCYLPLYYSWQIQRGQLGLAKPITDTLLQTRLWSGRRKCPPRPGEGR